MWTWVPAQKDAYVCFECLKCISNFCLYPLEAPCKERANDRRQKFGLLSMEVAKLTGDTWQAETRHLGQATVIVVTPEQRDLITRSYSTHRKLPSSVELFLVDEVLVPKEPCRSKP